MGNRPTAIAVSRWRGSHIKTKLWVDGEGSTSWRGSERMVREPCHDEAVSGWRGSHVTAKQWADGKGAMSQRSSEQMARESCHGEAVSGWRWSHVTAKQWADGKAAMSRWADGKGSTSRRDSGRIARDSGVHQWPILVLTSDRACSGAAKHQASVQLQSESGAG
jgi:hypothetical protein